MADTRTNAETGLIGTYNLGRKSRAKGLEPHDNPWKVGTPFFAAWLNGFMDEDRIARAIDATRPKREG